MSPSNEDRATNRGMDKGSQNGGTFVYVPVEEGKGWGVHRLEVIYFWGSRLQNENLTNVLLAA